VLRKNLVKQAMSEDLKPSGDITTKLIKNIAYKFFNYIFFYSFN